jgi:hypothetical protein
MHSGFFRFLGELDDAAFAVDRHHSEAGRFVQRHLDAAHRNLRAFLDVMREHAAVVHFVDVVAGQDQHMRRLMRANDVEVLVDRIRGAHVPAVLVDTLLRRQQFDELTELATEKAPGLLQMLDQRMAFVLGQHADPADTRVDAVGQREIDDAELAGDRHTRLGTPLRHRPEARATATGHDQRERALGEAADETRVRLALHSVLYSAGEVGSRVFEFHDSGSFAPRRFTRHRPWLSARRTTREAC